MNGMYDVSQFTDINIFCVLDDLIWNTISTYGLFSAGQMIKNRKEIKIDEWKWLVIESFI